MDLTSDAKEHCNWLDMQKPGESVSAGTLRRKRGRSLRLLLSSYFLWRLPSRRNSKTGIFYSLPEVNWPIDIRWKRFIEWDMKKANVLPNVLDDSTVISELFHDFVAPPFLSWVIIRAEMARSSVQLQSLLGDTYKFPSCHFALPGHLFCATGRNILP